MSTIAVTTSQNIELEYSLSSVGERIVAGLIDNGILLAYILVLAFSISMANLNKLFLLFFSASQDIYGKRVLSASSFSQLIHPSHPV